MIPIPSPEQVAIAQTYGLWIQTGAIAISAIAAFFLIYHNQKIACRRATLDLIMMQETSPSMIESRQRFIKLRNAGNIVQWITAENAASDEAVVIRNILNRYELAAIGIKQKILDEEIYKAWWRTTYVNDWIACKAFTVGMRTHLQVPKFCCEYEALARKWAKSEERDKI